MLPEMQYMQKSIIPMIRRMYNFGLYFLFTCFSLIISGTIMAGCGTEENLSINGLPEGSSWEDVQSKGSGTVEILYVPSGGFAYKNEEGELTGTTIEIFKIFFNWVEENYELDIEVNYTDETEWQRFYQMVASAGDGVIGTGNVTITKERREEIQFSPPYLNNIAVLISHESRPELTSIEDIPDVFADRTGLMYPGTLHGERMQYIRDNHYPDMPVDTVRSNGEIMKKMSEGDYYFTYVDVYNFAVAQDDGIPLRHHPVADDDDEQFGFILPLDSDWGKPLREFFETGDGFLESDTYRGIVREHLGESMMEVLEL